MNTFSPFRINPWREIAILMVVLMEVSWITPWFRALTPETYAVDAKRVLVILVLMSLLSHVLVRSMDYLHLKKSIRQTITIIFIFFGCFIGIKTMLYAQASVSLTELLTRPIRSFADVTTLIPVEFIIIVTILISIWRGITLAQEQIGPSTLVSHFWVGIIMFLAFTFLISIVTGEKAGDFFFLFIFCALLGVSSARMNVLGKVRGSFENKFSGSWFAGVVISAFIVVGLAFLVGILLRDQFSWIGSIFLGIFGSVLILIWALISPILSYLLTNFSGLISDSKVLSELEAGIENITRIMSGISDKISALAGIRWIEAFLARWGATIKTITFIIIIGLIVAGIIFWISISLWKDRERRRDSNEKSENLPKENILQSLMDVFRQGWNRAVKSISGIADLNKRKRLRAAARIRQIYADLMELCENLGEPRKESQTPLEYLPQLGNMFPMYYSELELITDAYLGVRYGLLSESQNEVAKVETAWRMVSTYGQEKLKDLQKGTKK